MDIGLIILLVIASVVGNIIKESKKQQERRNARSTPRYVKPRRDTEAPYKAPAKTQTNNYGQKELRPLSQGKSFKDTFEQMGKMIVDESFSLEGQRKDIGKTYETTVKDSYSSDDKPATDETIKKDEETQFSYQRMTFEDEDEAYESSTYRESYNSIGLDFDKENLIRGIILAEVLGPPRCRKR